MDIILLKTNNENWNELSGYLGCLDSARRKSVLKKAGDGDKINALLSRLLLLSELEKRTGIPMKKLSFVKGSYGKPYLKNSGLFFSMSHTNGAIAAAFSEDGEIGVDVEKKSRVINERMFERALSEDERKTAKTSEAFLDLWVRKEAFLKRLGIGITRDLRTVSAESLPDTVSIDCGEFFVGASGKGTAELSEIRLSELLDRFVKLV
ncbi:MAG: 4'-phosphopantetheinyl transferase superfamily protein [Oscillospiraceae bacterium]|nr:4'-phosphopantetheinyl transferase superfamily protein [Oscillospiraceae bacterium]